MIRVRVNLSMRLSPLSPTRYEYGFYQNSQLPLTDLRKSVFFLSILMIFSRGMDPMSVISQPGKESKYMIRNAT